MPSLKLTPEQVSRLSALLPEQARATLSYDEEGCVHFPVEHAAAVAACDLTVDTRQVKWARRVFPMAVLVKGGTKKFWAPLMIGYRDQHFDPAAGDKLFSTCLAALEAGYQAAEGDATTWAAARKLLGS